MVVVIEPLRVYRLSLPNKEVIFFLPYSFDYLLMRIISLFFIKLYEIISAWGVMIRKYIQKAKDNQGIIEKIKFKLMIELY